MERVQYLLDKRIIREVTPIFDTRALGYSSMLVAAKVDAANPHRAAQFINSHPGVTHNYLRNHEFNLWFTLAVEPDSKLGLDGTLDVMAAKTGAESIRQLPTLKLFKIRMDLEMEGGTDALKTAGEAVEPMELDPIELSRRGHRGHQGHAGADGGALATPTRPAAEKLGVPVDEVLSRLASLQERGGLRRVAAILYHRRAGFSANGMGVWAVPDGEILDTGRRMAAFRGDLALLPAPDLRRTGRTRSSRWPTGARRRSATRCWTRSRESTGIERARDAVLEHRVQEGPDALFHRRLQALGRGARALSASSLSDTRSAELYRRALHVLPGGVNSPVRAMRAIGRDPIFIERASGAELTDVDGNVYVDYVCSWGPLIHGHAHPAIIEAVTEAAALGTSYGAPTAGEVELAEAITARMPSVDMLRMTSSGTEASMSAIRLARAATGRDKLLKFAGAYHGHVDGLLAQAGSGLATQGIPSSPGVPAAAAADTVVVPWNDPEAVRRAFAEHELAAVLVEPYPANMGLIPPAPGFLELLRDLCTGYDTLLVFDEVITGFRVAPGGAQELTGVLPDLTVMGKILGGGLPAAAFGGSAALMERIAPGRRRLPGRHAEREPARGRRRARHARAARRAGVHDARATPRARSPTACARRRATARSP